MRTAMTKTPPASPTRHTFLTIATLALLVAGFAAGCATTGAGTLNEIEVKATTPTTFFVAGEPVASGRLARTLKAGGAGPTTAIQVEIPDDFGTANMKRVTELLVQGGLPRIVFTKSRRATAEVEKAP